MIEPEFAFGGCDETLSNKSRKRKKSSRQADQNIEFSSAKQRNRFQTSNHALPTSSRSNGTASGPKTQITQQSRPKSETNYDESLPHKHSAKAASIQLCNGRSRDYKIFSENMSALEDRQKKCNDNQLTYYETNGQFKEECKTYSNHIILRMRYALTAVAAASLTMIAVASVRGSPSLSDVSSTNGTNLSVLNNNHIILDGRACVTATYLCVLIVNMSWIDCKLLKNLCKNNSSLDNKAFSDRQLLGALYQLEHPNPKPVYTSTRNGRLSSIYESDDGRHSVSNDNLSDLVEAAATPVGIGHNQAGIRHRLDWRARSTGNVFSEMEGEHHPDETIAIRSKQNLRNHHQPPHQQHLIPNSRGPSTRIGDRDKFDNLVAKSTHINLADSQFINHDSISTPPTTSSTFSIDDATTMTGPSNQEHISSHNDQLGSVSQHINVVRSNPKNYQPSRSISDQEQNFVIHHDDPSQPLVRLDSDGHNILRNYSSSQHAPRAACCADDRIHYNDGKQNNILTIVPQPPIVANSQVIHQATAPLSSSFTNANPPSSTGPPSGSILPSWMRSPFRWGSISIWPQGGGQQSSTQQDDDLNEESNQIKSTPEIGAISFAEPTIATIQILRPVVERGDHLSTVSLPLNLYEQTSTATMLNQTLNLANQMFSHTPSSNNNDFQDQLQQQQQPNRFTFLRPQQASAPESSTNFLNVRPSPIASAQIGALYNQKQPANRGPSPDMTFEQSIGCDCESGDPMHQTRTILRQGIDRASGHNEMINAMANTNANLYSACQVQCLLEQQQRQSSSNVDTSQNIQMTSSESSSSPITSVPSSGSSSATNSNSNNNNNNNGNNSGNLPPPNPNSQTAKPLEVSFILYTRHHRDLAHNFAFSQLPKSASSSAIAAAATVASNHLMNGGELIDLMSTDEATGLLGRGALSSPLLALNTSLPIKMIIHGFGSGARRPWVADMVYKLLEYEDVIVIVVDWERGAALPNYVQAAGNTRLVGHRIANFIKTANQNYGFKGHQYHLIGFSLGAHVAGFAGMECNSTLHPRIVIQRITGLDPASPLFEGYEANDRLDPSDANFVDVIHSNGDGVLRGGFGSLQPMGHVDFYPNGGRVQVGCNSVLLSALSDIIYGKWQSLCNHRRALNFFMDSFETSKCKFRSFKCDSYESYVRGECFDCGFNNEACSYMGYRADRSIARGKMYLTTHEEAPFCANQFIIKLIGTKGYKTTWGKIEVTLVTFDGKNESFWLSPSLNREHRDHHHQQTSIPSPSSSASTLIVSSPSITSNGANGIAGIGNNQAFVSGINGAVMSGASGGGTGNTMSAQVSSSSGQNGEIGGQKLDERPVASQMSLQSLIVAHPSLTNFTQVLLRYTRYKGWIYSGDESWSIDKVFLMDSYGDVKSFCGSNTILESHITTRVNLTSGNCTVTEPPCCANSNNNSNILKTMNARGFPIAGMQSDQPSPPTSTSSDMSLDLTDSTPNILMSNSRSSQGGGQMRIPRLYATLMNADDLTTTTSNLNIYNQQLQPVNQQLAMPFGAGAGGFAFQNFAPQLNRDSTINLMPNSVIKNQQTKKSRHQQANLNQQHLQQQPHLGQQFVGQQSSTANNLSPNYHHEFVNF